MTRRLTRALLACAFAAIAATGLAGSAQANVQIPGLNGKIAFTSDRDFAFTPPLTKGFGQPDCFEQTSNFECSLEIYSMNPDGGAQTRLTNNVAGDDEAAWLPADGANIAFESDRATPVDQCEETCSWDIWSMTGDGNSPLQLTHNDGDELHPTYSPDGTRIAYYATNPDLERSLFPGIDTEIFIIPASGESGLPTPLLPADQTGEVGPTSVAFDSWPAWSPDGTKIAFTRFSESATQAGAASIRGVTASLTFDVRTWVAPANGSGPATPVETYAPCVIQNVNNTTITSIERALTSRSGRARSAALDARGAIFPNNCTWDIKPAWSPDGGTIAATRLSGRLIADGASTRLALPSQDPGDIAVFNSANGSGDTNLSNVTEPADCNTVVDSPFCSTDEYPTWSPDGTKIVFDSNRSATGDVPSGCFDGEAGSDFCDYEIWTMNADGSNPTQLTSNAADDFDPDWQRIPPPPPPAPAAPAAPVKPKVGVAGVRRACVSKAFHVRFRVSTTASTVKRVVVKLDGKRIKSTAKGSFTLTINSRKLKAGRHRLTITATNAAGQTTTSHKSFSVCRAAKPKRKAAPRFTG
jgi:Tol biopolymer transport system component